MRCCAYRWLRFQFEVLMCFLSLTKCVWWTLFLWREYKCSFWGALLGKCLLQTFYSAAHTLLRISFPRSPALRKAKRDTEKHHLCWRANKLIWPQQMTVTKCLIKYRWFIYPLQDRLQSHTCTLDAYWSLADFSHISRFWQIVLSQKRQICLYSESQWLRLCRDKKSAQQQQKVICHGWLSKEGSLN